MADYYYGSEGKFDWITEDITAYGTGVTPTERLAWVKSASITVNENTEWQWNFGGSTIRKPSDAVKGQFEVSGNVTFWMPDDLDGTALDAWILKMPCDAYNLAHDGTQWNVPNNTSSVYGSFKLMSFTVEMGHDKVKATPNYNLHHTVTGCVADSFTLRARRGERIEFSLDWIGQDHSFDSIAFETISKSTANPLGWEHCTVGYADDGTETARTDFTAFEFTINNNLIRNYDLTSATPKRALTSLIPERQEISGSFTINLTNTVGMELWDDLLNDVIAPHVSAEGAKKKQLVLNIKNHDDPATEAIQYTFRNVVISEIPLDIDPTKIQEVTVNWTAQYYLLELITADTGGPTNWSIIGEA